MVMKYEHLVGLPFEWGVRDCLAMFRNLYWDNWQIPITDYARPDDWAGRSADLIRMTYAREGFSMISKEAMPRSALRPGDVACIAVGSSIPNHFAVYIGDNTICHHKTGTLSNTELYRDFWRGYTSFFLRHPDVPDMTPKYPDVDLGELIRAGRSFQTAEKVEGEG